MVSAQVAIMVGSEIGLAISWLTTVFTLSVDADAAARVAASWAMAWASVGISIPFLFF
jgi:hypothetical protein